MYKINFAYANLPVRVMAAISARDDMEISLLVYYLPWVSFEFLTTDIERLNTVISRWLFQFFQ